MKPVESWIKQAIKDPRCVHVSTNVLLNQPISELNPQNPPGALSRTPNCSLQRKTFTHIENPNRFQALQVKHSTCTGIRGALGVVGSAWQTVKAISKAASYLSEVILLNHPPKQIA